MVRTNDRDVEILNHSLKVCNEYGGSINLHHAINFVKNLFSKKKSKKNQPEKEEYYGYNPNNNDTPPPDPHFFERFKKQQQESQFKQENNKKEMPKPPPQHIPEYKKSERKEYEYKAPPPPSYSRPYHKNEHHYQTLGLTSDASDEDAKKAYRKLSMKYHPDKNPDNPDATRKFQDINTAYSAIVGRGIKKKVSFKSMKDKMHYVRSHKKLSK